MRTISNPRAYFEAKTGLTNEIERKVLRINAGDLTSRMEDARCLEVFQGVVTSLYFEGDPLAVFGPFMIRRLIPGLVITTGDVNGTKAWIRLRQMIDEKTGERFHFGETKSYLGDETGKRVGYVEFSKAIDHRVFDDLRTDYLKSGTVNLRETEAKRRGVYVLPPYTDESEYRHGIEYSIDSITQPVIIDSLLEIEVNEAELLAEAAQILGIPLDSLIQKSTRKLIEEAKASVHS